MKRRVFGFVCILSGLMCVATGLAWAASYAAALELAYESGEVRYELVAFRGLWVIRHLSPWGESGGLSVHIEPLEDWHPEAAWYQAHCWAEVDSRGLWGFQSVRAKFHFFSLRTYHVLVDCRALSAPHWAAALLTAVLPAVRVVRRVRQLRRLPKEDAEQRRKLRLQICEAVIAALLLGCTVAALRASVHEFTRPQWPLIAAIRHGDLPAVQRLIADGADVNAPDDTGRTALHWAVFQGRTFLNEIRCQSPCVDAVDDQGRTALHYAAGRDGGMAARLLFDKARTDIRDADGMTALHAAGKHGRWDSARALLDAGADVNALDGAGRSALLLALAAYDGPDELIELLLARGARADAVATDGRTALHEAAAQGRVEIFRTLLAEGLGPAVADNAGVTPLHEAARHGPAITKLLLAKGADVNAVAATGRTPLHDAAWAGQEATADLLLAAGAKATGRDDQGRTPLLWAAVSDRPKLVAKLIDRGAAVDERSSNGRTALHWAALTSEPEVVRVLLARGADVHAVDAEGKTALHEAVDRRRGYQVEEGLGVARLLLDAGAKVNTSDVNGRTPLHWAVHAGAESIVALLLERGAAVGAKDKDGDTPADVAGWQAEEHVWDEHDVERFRRIERLLARRATGHDGADSR